MRVCEGEERQSGETEGVCECEGEKRGGERKRE